MALAKRAVRLNGLQHGLLSRDVVLPGEDESAFEVLRSEVHADLAPSGPVETFLADRVVNTFWRLRRLERAETALFHWRVYGLKAEHLTAKVRAHEVTNCVGGFEIPMLAHYETVITNEAAHELAKKALGQPPRGSPSLVRVSTR